LGKGEGETTKNDFGLWMFGFGLGRRKKRTGGANHQRIVSRGGRGVHRWEKNIKKAPPFREALFKSLTLI